MWSLSTPARVAPSVLGIFVLRGIGGVAPDSMLYQLLLSVLSLLPFGYFLRAASIKLVRPSIVTRRHMVTEAVMVCSLFLVTVFYSGVKQRRDWPLREGHLLQVVTSMSVLLGGRFLTIFWGSAVYVKQAFFAGHTLTLLVRLAAVQSIAFYATALCTTYSRDAGAIIMFANLSANIAWLASPMENANFLHAIVEVVGVVLPTYVYFLWVNYGRILDTKGCKFLRMSYLRRMRRESRRFARCQEVPPEAFGDVFKAKYIVTLSHRWCDRRFCDVATAETPGGLRMEDMMEMLEKEFGNQASWWSWLCNIRAGMTTGSDVLVFIDFMCLPQEGIGEDGQTVPRTDAEKELFFKCLPLMSVFYSFFDVLVSSTVPPGVHPYEASGWCFCELTIATLSQRLSRFPARLPAGSEMRKSPDMSIDDFVHSAGLQLDEKCFFNEADREAVRQIIAHFSMKCKITDAIRAGDGGRFQALLDQLRRDGQTELLDQPVNDNLDTPLHFCVQSRFVDGANLLLREGANPRQRNKWGDTPFEFYLFPRFSKAARVCRASRARTEAAVPGASNLELEEGHRGQPGAPAGPATEAVEVFPTAGSRGEGDQVSEPAKIWI